MVGNPSAIEGKTVNIKKFANRTFGITLNKFAVEF